MDQDNLEKDKQRLVVMGVVIAVLIVLLLIGTLIAMAFNGTGDEKKEDTASEISTYAPSNMKFFEDMYRGRILIPKFDFPESDYELEKFSEVNGKIMYDSPDSAFGVDVSSHQQTIDWAQVKAGGVDFAIIRAGYRGYSEGGMQEDEFFDYNVQSAIENGIDVGVYFFSQAITEKEAIEEAEYTLKKIKGYDITYPVYFDWELPLADSPRTKNSTGEEITSFAKAFCQRVEKDGYRGGFYTNKNMGYELFDFDELKDYEFWYAEYQDLPSFNYKYGIWQFTESGTISGISTNVDMNVSFKKYGK